MQKGHMKQVKQGVRSTKVIDKDAMLEFKPQPGVKHKDVYLRVFDATKKAMYTDQTGKFPITSSRGNKYLMVAVELDGNFIDAEPLKTRTAQSLTKAYEAIHARWKATRVICPNWHILDNEAPEELKQAIRENGCRVELTPADQHRQNIAERAIQTFKGHFISVLAGVADDFPIHQWDELLPQTILALNLLRQSNIAPNISAYAYIIMAILIMTECHWLQWVAQFSFTSSQTDGKRGVNIQVMAGILALHQTTTDHGGSL
jgi:hypothetical protein